MNQALIKREDDIEEEIAYIAGLMDGDGSFSFLRSKKRYYPCLQLSNTILEMPYYLFSKFGGSIRKKTLQKQAQKQASVWSLRGYQSCQEVLRKIVKYLVLKKERAELLLEHISNSIGAITNRGRGQDGRFVESRYQFVKDEEFAVRMQILNDHCLIEPQGFHTLPKTAVENSLAWAYIAGIMDTEGSFSIKKEKPHSGSKSVRYNSMIQLSMATVASINFLRSVFERGNTCIAKAKTAQRGCVYRFSMTSKKDTIFFLDQLLPFLKFKKERALVLYDFCRVHTKTQWRRGGISSNELEFRESCYQKLVRMNR